MVGLPGNVLKINDAAWLLSETRRTPMHVGMLATLTMPDDADECYLEDLVNHWRTVHTFKPPFNYQLVGPGPLLRWRELPDDRIDLDYHLRHSAVPSPGGEKQLGVLVSRLHSVPLDRRYPLWECHVIEGVEEGRWSLYMKVHHSQIDGVGGIRLGHRIFSVDPDHRGMLPPWAVGTSGPDQSGLPADPGARPDSELPDLLAAGRETVSVVGSLGKTYAESITGLHRRRRAVPFRAPQSILNSRIHAPRRFAGQTYDVQRLRSVGKAAGGSLNDVFLAMCGGALRRYLTEIDALPQESLTANVPVSVRPAGGAQVGNAITFLYASLGTDVADPVERVQAVHESTRRAKERLPRAGVSLMDLYTTALMGPFLGQAVLGVGGLGPPDANLVVSNVPGLPQPRYYNGSRLDEYYPLSLLFHGQALNITAVSNAGTFCVGFTGCRDTLPHLQRIAVYCTEALEEIESALTTAS